jgi:alkylation response protein AidB-like acyl-CoA dehydrogenase
MNFAFDAEQEEFRRTLRRFLEQRSPLAATREMMESERPYSPDVWQQASEQLGLPGLIVGEEHGGQGFSFIELVIACEELGRVLSGLPYLPTMSAVLAIQAAGSPAQRKELLPGLAAGARTGALATSEPGQGWGPDGISALAEGDGPQVTLRGRKSYVIGGHSADVLVVAARRRGTSGEDGIVLATLDGTAPGVRRRALDAIDPTRRVAELELDGATGYVLEQGSWPVLARVLDRVQVALAAEMIGGAQRCLERAVDYAKQRHQFGRAIGSFQAIKHLCADMFVEVESARSAMYYAAWAADEDNEELPVVAPLAKAYASQAYSFAAAESLHVRGGIGFTWEDDAHLYFKRAKASELMYGDAAANKELMATRLGLRAPG